MARVEIVAVVLTISDSASRGEREENPARRSLPNLKSSARAFAATEILSDDRDGSPPGSASMQIGAM